MFGFNKKKKKEKTKPTLTWEEEMTELYSDTGLTSDLKLHPEEILTYGLSYLNEYLKVQREKDKLASRIKLKFLITFGELTQAQAESLTKRIEGSTRSSDPLVFELLFLGVEAYTLQASGNRESLPAQGDVIKNLLNKRIT